MANIAAVKTGRGEGINDEEVFTRVLAGESELCEIVMRRPYSQTFSRPSGFHATFESKRIWWINSSITARCGWRFLLNELQGPVVDRSLSNTTAPERILRKMFNFGPFLKSKFVNYAPHKRVCGGFFAAGLFAETLFRHAEG